MKYSLFSAAIGGLMLFNQPAAAASSYLLQLGTFAEEAQAESHWTRMQEKYPDLLQGLNLRVANVTLAPDNMAVYRTQAALLSQRSDAEIICDAMARKGDECFIVETAMIASAPQAAPKPVMPQPAPVQTAAAQAPQPLMTLPPVEDVMPTAELSSKAEEQLAAMEAALDAESASFESKGAALMPDAPTIAMPSVQAPVIVTPPVIEPGTGLKALPQTLQAPQPLIAVPTVTAPQQAIQPLPELADNRPRQADFGNVQLPPPPAFFDQPSDFRPAAPVVAQQPAAQSAAAPVVPENAPFRAVPKETYAQAAGMTPPPVVQEAPVQNATQADVAVAEAIRVPLSDMAPPVVMAAPQPVVPARRYPTAGEMMKLGLPSRPSMTRSMWAELSYFDSEQAALGYWENIRRSMPDLPLLRVRVVKPYRFRNEINRVSLKVGPFPHAAQLRELCDRIENEDMYCRMSNDLGSSTLADYRRGSSADGQLQQQYAVPQHAQPMYWLQLGSYEHPQAAWEEWQFLQQRHAPVLDPITPQIVTPELSSSADPVYRMRVGPYLMRNGADQLCGILQRFGTQCVTVFAR
jgi:hypothetical protein